MDPNKGKALGSGSTWRIRVQEAKIALKKGQFTVFNGCRKLKIGGFTFEKL